MTYLVYDNKSNDLLDVVELETDKEKEIYRKKHKEVILERAAMIICDEEFFDD